jgi:hypothetical protein
VPKRCGLLFKRDGDPDNGEPIAVDHVKQIGFGRRGLNANVPT